VRCGFFYGYLDGVAARHNWEQLKTLLSFCLKQVRTPAYCVNHMLFPVLCLLSPCSQPRLIWKLNPGECFEITIMFLLRFLWNFIDMFYHHFMVQVLEDYYGSHVDAAVGPPRPLITGETFQQLQDRLDSGI
jgi:hypothetical protein